MNDIVKEIDSYIKRTIVNTVKNFRKYEIRKFQKEQIRLFDEKQYCSRVSNGVK